MYDVAVIGTGVIGTAIARELSRYDLKVVVLEKENDICTGASKANSGIIHAGYDPEENTLMAHLNVKANKMYDTICEELSVPFKRNGALVLAFDDEQLSHINQLKQRGINNGVSSLSILSKDEVLAKEPSVSPEIKGALFAGTSGIIDPMLLTLSQMENAVMNGAEYFLNFNVESIEKGNGNFKIIPLDDPGFPAEKPVSAKYVINAAGVFADKIRNMVTQPAFTISPRCGQYYLLDKLEEGIVNSTIFPCPGKVGKGILVVPTVHGNVMLGPSSDDVSDKENVGTSDELLEEARKRARILIPKITTRNTIRTFSGLRAVADCDDFIIKEAEGAPNFIDVAGIKSPGLTAAPAIAVHVVSLLQEKGLALNKKQFNPIVKRKLLIEMSEEEQSALIKTNPLYGRIICRCENITEGDIVDAIKRSPGAVTLDGVKRRCRAGMGRCQGGFCAPKVQQILARELSTPLEKIMLEKKSSYILTGLTK